MNTEAHELVSFLETLFHDGAVLLKSPRPLKSDELAAGVDWIVRQEPQIRDHWPGEPPAVRRSQVAWATGMFFRACQLLVFRELGTDVIDRDLSTACPPPHDASAVYSVDLVFRFLPDLWRIARAASESDPLVRQLEHWGQAWPLSSVRIKRDTLGELSPILEDHSLRQLLIDRVVAGRATAYLEHDLLRQYVHSQLVSHPELAPELWRSLSRTARPGSTAPQLPGQPPTL